ncbi:MAG: phosphoribosylaminoimidazolesuccinocarboxamide synthase [Dehalococcoidia bacterium]|nr:phosphoribosylaminoimidazolesuccinocarboxamide synthase [Dehalococcoidia bacterium]
MADTILETTLPLPLYGKGKVRDTYDLGGSLLIVATDRISAFDVVLPCAIPAKGRVLNQLSAFWFSKTHHIVDNHVIAPVERIGDLPGAIAHVKPRPSFLFGRSMVVRKARLIPVECVVRGYISGSAWAEHVDSGSVCGLKLSSNLRDSERLSEPIFTPTTKAETGHDMPLTRKGIVGLIGESLADQIEGHSKDVYAFARDYAITRGIIIADTKMEFGIVDGKVILIDELLTPDSSRFWEASTYVVGRSQASYDKQPVRDWLAQSGWDKKAPAPMLPDEAIRQTTERYSEAYRRLTGKELK